MEGRQRVCPVLPQRGRWRALFVAVSLALHAAVLTLLPAPQADDRAAILPIEIRILDEPQPRPPMLQLPFAEPAPAPSADTQRPLTPGTQKTPTRQVAAKPVAQFASQLEPVTETAAATHNTEPPAAPENIESQGDVKSAGTSAAAIAKEVPVKVADTGPGGEAAGQSAGEQPAAQPAPAPSGGGNAAGAGVDVEGLLREYGRGVNASIQSRKYYPEAGRRLGLTGSVKLYLVVAASGELLSVSVSGSSGHSELDEAAIDAVERAAPFDPLPAECGKQQQPFTFRLKYSLE